MAMEKVNKMGSYSGKIQENNEKLVSDALPAETETSPSTYLDIDVLENIEEELELRDKISLLFLILDDYLMFPQVLEAIYSDNGKNIFTQFVLNIKNWQTKFVEALCLTKNKRIIRKLGLNYEEQEIIYLPTTFFTDPQILTTPKVHFGAKFLWYLFDNVLDAKQSRELLKLIYLNIEPPDRISEDDELELHALHWIEKGYITLAKNGYGDLDEILKHLKRLGICGTFYNDLEKYCNNSKGKLPQPKRAEKSENEMKIKADIETNSKIKYNRHNVLYRDIHNKIPESHFNFPSPQKFINSAYVIILNIITVPGSVYKDRLGSDADVKRLENTFRGLKYTVDVYNEPSARQIDQIFFNVKKNFDRSNYDGLFVCILSHGIKGHFISHDNVEIPLSQIENYMCNHRLQGLPKIILVQACQGSKTGVPLVAKLVVDGPTTSDIKNTLDHQDFFLFYSTMQDCKAIRHEIDGSWFIEAVCEVLQKTKTSDLSLSVDDWALKVTKLVADKRGTLDNGIQASQLPENVSRLTDKFYFPRYQAVIGI